MYTSKNKAAIVPSDAQARDKLIYYVHEYLCHVGANKAAETFLKEIHYDKGLSISGDSPGFLFSWWSVFWDLYSSAPERRQHNLHSDEAKAFHEYNFLNVNGQQQQQQQQNNGQMYMNGMQHNSNAPSPLGMPGNPNDVGISGGMPGPMPGNPNFFPNSHMRTPPNQPVNQPSPQMMQNQPFISPRGPHSFSGPRGPNVRMPQDFNPPPTGVPGQPPMGPGNNMDPNRQDGDFVWQGPPMQQINPRMAGPHQNRMPQMGPGQMGNMSQFPTSMRPPNGPVNGQPQPNGQMPINMPGGPPPGRQWANNNMNYNSPSPGNHYGPPVSNSGPAPPQSIMPSPQGSAPYSPASHRMGTPNTGRDSSGSDVSMFNPMMKANFVMNEPPNLQQAPTSSPLPNDQIIDSIKQQSPGHNVVPPDQQNPEHNSIDYNNIAYAENDQNESAAILKIKESMQEEAKRFEKDPPELIDSNFNY